VAVIAAPVPPLLLVEDEGVRRDIEEGAARYRETSKKVCRENVRGKACAREFARIVA
jgi:hypothetical protein